jgi:hypothetical protein
MRQIIVKYDKFWDEQLSDPGIIIRGNHYRTGNSKTKSKWNGFGGQDFRIRMLDTGKIIETCDLWHQGEIPKFYAMKDNAEFIK